MNIKNLFLSYSSKKKELNPEPQGLGTFYGVYLPGVLAMFGVIIFLRFGQILGGLGLIATIAVVTLSCLIVLLTTLSIASAATNMEVKRGGTYYMVSRSLGIEVGSAIGIPLFIAQALCISFCAVGFAESIHPYFPEVPLNYLGAATLVIIMGFVYLSESIAVKSQSVIFLIMLGALASLFLGKNLITDSSETFDKTLSTPFWIGFALFFPATSGFEAGLALSGNLQSARKSIPFGSIAILLTGFLVYLCIPFFLWTHVPRNLLASDPLIFQHVAIFGPLIVVGIWAATLSSVLGGLIAAPRTLQALAGDGVFPRFLAKEWGKNKEPRMARVLCFIIALIGILYGSIDQIAPVLTMFYLIAYATLNLATGLEELLGNPSWRPTFRIHWIIPISGLILCLFAMFMISAGATFTSLTFVITVYFFMKKRNLVKKWGDIWQGFLIFLSRAAIYKLAGDQLSARSWRPNFLVLSNSPMQVSHLMNMTSAISKGKGFLTLASIFSPKVMDYERAERWKKMISSRLKENRIEALVEFCMDESLLSGAKKLLMSYGMGSISPNTIVLGEMKNHEANKEYIGVIQATCEAKKNLIIVRDNQTILKPANAIHVWWDDLSKSNSEFMILLSHMLMANKIYKKSKVHLNSIASSETGKLQRLKYFSDTFSKKRFLFTPNIYIKDKDTLPWELMTEVSSKADMVIIGINPPNNGRDLDELAEYYYKVVNDTKGIPNAVFVICAESFDTTEIFN